MMGIKIPWQVFACAGLVALGAFLFGLGWIKGSDHKQNQWNNSLAAGTVLVSKATVAQDKITTRVEIKYIDRWRTIHEKGQTITQLVPQYIPSGTCDLPGGFRLLHDAAVTGTIPSTTGGPDAAPVPVTDAATTVTGNYATCREAISDLEGLREWAQAQHQEYLELCKQRGVVCSKDK